LAEQDTVRVDYTQGAELTPTKFQRVPYSTPDSNWTTTDSTLVEDFGVAPDGTQSASKVTKSAVSSNDRVKYPTISIANGTTYSVSVHLKNIDVAGFTTIAARVSGGSLFRVRFIWDTSALSSDTGTTSNRLGFHTNSRVAAGKLYNYGDCNDTCFRCVHKQRFCSCFIISYMGTTA